MSRLPSSSLEAARKWPMLVMHEPMNTSSIFCARHLGQRLHVVRVVRAGDDRLVDVGQVDLDHGGVLGVRIGVAAAAGLAATLPAPRCGAPACARRLIAVGDHPAHQGDVAVDVLDDRLLVQVHGAAGGRALGGSVGQLERLLDLQVGQALDLEDAAREDVLLALLLDRQQALLDRVQRDRVDQVAQGDAGLHLALEAHQHRSRACPAA